MGKKKKVQRIVLPIMFVLEAVIIVMSVLTTTETSSDPPPSNCFPQHSLKYCLCLEHTYAMFGCAVALIVLCGIVMALEIMNLVFSCKGKKQRVFGIAVLCTILHLPCFILNIPTLGMLDDIITDGNCANFPPGAYQGVGLACGIVCLILSIVFTIVSGGRAHINSAAGPAKTVQPAVGMTAAAAPYPGPAAPYPGAAAPYPGTAAPPYAAGAAPTPYGAPAPYAAAPPGGAYAVDPAAPGYATPV